MTRSRAVSPCFRSDGHRAGADGGHSGGAALRRRHKARRRRIRGTVEDSSGGVLPGATVTLTNAATKAMQTAVTDDRGGYLFTAIFSGV